MDLNTVPEPSTGAPKLPCQAKRQYPPDSACFVYVNHIEDNGSLWVMLESEFNILDVISTALNENVKLQNVTSLQVNDVVSALNLDNAWYRAIILETEPRICVRLIDFGDTIVVSPDKLAMLPPTLSVIQPLAMKVKLPPESKIKPVVGTSFLVKYIGSDIGVTVVDAVIPKSGNMELDSTQSSDENPDKNQAFTIKRDEGKVTDLEESPCLDTSDMSGEQSAVDASLPLDSPALESCHIEPSSSEQSAVGESLPPESQALKGSGCHVELLSGEQSAIDESLPPDFLAQEGPDCYVELLSGEQSAVGESQPPDSTALKGPDCYVELLSGEQSAIEESLPPDSPALEGPDCYVELLSGEQSAVGESQPPDSTALKGPDCFVELLSGEQSAIEESLPPDSPALEGPDSYIEASSSEQSAVDNSLPSDPPSLIFPGSVVESAKGVQAGANDSLPTDAIESLSCSEVLCELPAHTTCSSDSGVRDEGNPTENFDNPSDLSTEEVDQKIPNAVRPKCCVDASTASYEFPVKLDTTEKTAQPFPEALESVRFSSHDMRLPGNGVRTVLTEAGKLLVKGWLQGPVWNDVSGVKRNSVQTQNVDAPMRNTESTTEPPKGNNFKRGYTEESVIDSFTSVCGQYPHHGGYGRTGYVEDIGGSGDYKHAPSQAHAPRSITKGRKTSPQPFCGQDTSESNSLPVQPKSSSQASASQEAPPRNMVSNFSPDFKTILEFELSIIREQNRLQMLQLQKKMEQNFVNQINTLKEDMTKQLSKYLSEVNNRLTVLNDSVVHKMADIYSVITMLKNDQEMFKQSQSGMPASSGASAVNSGQMLQYQNSHSCSMQPHSTSYNRSEGSSDAHRNGQHHFKEYKKDDNIQGKSRNMSKFPFNTRKQYPKQPVNSSDLEVTGGPVNRLMSIRKEKMEKNKEMVHHYHAASMPEGNESSPPDQQHPSFSVGQFTVNSYPKMDYFDPSKAGSEKGQEFSGNKCTSGSIICANNLAEKLNPDLLFNLFGVYGIVLKVKMSQQEKGRAFIEMGDAAQAEEAVRFLNNVPLMGHRLHVAPCSFDKLNLSRQEFQSNTCKDFTKPNLMKLNRFKYMKWDAYKLFAPCQRLMITNVLNSVPDEKIKEEFAKRGFHIQNISSQPCSNDEKKLVFASLGSLEEAVNALTVMHLQELSDWMMMRISFAKPDKRRGDFHCEDKV